MKQRWTALRNGMLAAVFLASMGFGAVQATAGDGIEKEAACSAWACQQECAPFGGDASAKAMLQVLEGNVVALSKQALSRNVRKTVAGLARGP
ncbi:hypothetical protein, partial [Xanthomonas sacchari]|uniref:hypothetical protein n=1 Tax=Xanthomonas sacchari TaxID=56458 RepID=UPI00225E14D5